MGLSSLSSTPTSTAQWTKSGLCPVVKKCRIMTPKVLTSVRQAARSIAHRSKSCNTPLLSNCATKSNIQTRCSICRTTTVSSMSTSTSSVPKISVFYDGKCGLCDKEISHYKKIAPSEIFNWQDITECDKQLRERGVSLAEGLKLLHSVDREGQLHVGVDSFILIWKQLNYLPWGAMASLVSFYPVRKIADAAYRLFAQKRFDKLEHCQLAAKKERKTGD